MVPFILFAIEKFRAIIRHNLGRVAILLVGVIVYGTLSQYALERGAPGSGIQGLFDSLWFTVQTITTVGYGEIPVVTTLGRVNAMAIMFAGIGILGFFTAGVASEFIEYVLQKQRGKREVKMKDHVVLCNWNILGPEIVAEVMDEGLNLVVLAPLEESPLNHLSFVNGTGLHLADLEKANIRQARAAIILAEPLDDVRLASAADATSVLSIMNIKKLNPSAHVVVELLRPDSVENAKAGGADEVLVWGDLTAKILARGVVDPGTIDIMETILTAKSGEEIFEDAIPSDLIGKPYRDLVMRLLDRNATPLALRKNERIQVNPGKEEILTEESFIYIARGRLRL